MVFVTSVLLGFAASSFAQDRSAEAANNVQRVRSVDRTQQARVQQARAKQVRMDQADLTQQRMEQARIKQARIENARQKQQRIKQARVKEARLNAAGDDQQFNRRRHHKAEMQAKRKRLANQSANSDPADN